MYEDMKYTESGWAIWPVAEIPQPSINMIRQVACDVMGYPEPDWDVQGTRNERTSMCRAMVSVICRVLLKLSYPESAAAAGYRSHATVMSPDSQAQHFMNSEAGRVLFNAIVERLAEVVLRDEYKQAAQRSLKNHAGSAIHTDE